jgi:hypothetical protein
MVMPSAREKKEQNSPLPSWLPRADHFLGRLESLIHEKVQLRRRFFGRLSF